MGFAGKGQIPVVDRDHHNWLPKSNRALDDARVQSIVPKRHDRSVLKDAYTCNNTLFSTPYFKATWSTEVSIWNDWKIFDATHLHISTEQNKSIQSLEEIILYWRTTATGSFEDEFTPLGLITLSERPSHEYKVNGEFINHWQLKVLTILAPIFRRCQSCGEYRIRWGILLRARQPICSCVERRDIGGNRQRPTETTAETISFLMTKSEKA